MIVIDTNVIVYLLVKSGFTRIAESVYEKDSHWIAPPLWESEFRNVLTMYMRNRELVLPEAYQLMQKAEALMNGDTYQVTSETVLELAHRSGCSAYDCEFVALALDLGLPLVTSDKKLIACFPDLVIPLDAFAP